MLNVVAVVALREVPHTYAPGDVPAWLAETLAHPTASTVSAVSFTVGLVLLAAFFGGLAATSMVARRSVAVVAAVLFGGGALLDAAGTPAVIAALHSSSSDVGVALLWVTLLLDSAFNALLGLGLVVFAFALGAGAPRWVRVWAFVAGLASLPVGLQFLSDSFARLLAVSGPLWLGWIFVVSVRLMMDSPHPEPSPQGERG
ncbi:MAG: hypothetical protein U0228_25240 [Myxococcaceae bacterium]